MIFFMTIGRIRGKTLKCFFVSYMRRSAKFFILNKEGIIETISYVRRAYESVDEKSLS